MSSADEKARRRTAWEAARSIYAREPCGQLRAEKMAADRFQVFEMLLAPLEAIREDPHSHPEGDVLYHSLQVFALARERLPYDEEFLLAALLHDVGKGLDALDHAAAAVAALEGFITPRTAWLIAHHVAGLRLRNGTLGARSRRRLEASENFEELMLLVECDVAGRAVGIAVPDLKEALQYLRQLERECEAPEPPQS